MLHTDTIHTKTNLLLYSLGNMGDDICVSRTALAATNSAIFSSSPSVAICLNVGWMHEPNFIYRMNAKSRKKRTICEQFNIMLNPFHTVDAQMSKIISWHFFVGWKNAARVYWPKNDNFSFVCIFQWKIKKKIKRQQTPDRLIQCEFIEKRKLICGLQ